jgi:hypothetical protein
MKKNATIFLQIVIILIGVGALALLLWEPHLEGRNAHATLSEIYFNDPFLACAYAVSIAFFVALYKVFKLLGHIGRNELFSQASVNALRTIKYCAIILIASLAAAEAYLFIVQRGKDDIAGGVAIGLVLILSSTVVAAAAAQFEKVLSKRLGANKNIH